MQKLASPILLRCPKCNADPRSPCVSIKQGGRIGRFPYKFHKKREHAAIMVALVLGSHGPVPVRPSAARRRQVGPVDSAVEGR